jgi:tRNA nucleotidyltransferase (CCA-adding enzyme)
MFKDYAVGIIIFHRFPNKVKYLLLKHRQGHWAFCKGHKDSGETKLETAVRELKEETGITGVNLLKKKILLNEHYIFKNGNTVKKLKTIDYFIAESPKIKIKIDGWEIRNFRWCGYNAALKQITFSQSRATLRKANKFIEAYSDYEK